jgi:hypothetical protein
MEQGLKGVFLLSILEATKKQLSFLCLEFFTELDTFSPHLDDYDVTFIFE